jgi:hypothetical protein
MSVRTLLVSSVLASVLVIGMAFTARPAEADPNKAFNGQIMLSKKRFPLSAKSKAAYTAAIRKQSAKAFHEDKEKQQWKIYFAAFLKQPLNDVEYVVKFYEVGRGGQHLIGASEAFNDTRGQREIISNIVLDRKSFGVNKELLMTIENRGKVYASGRFKILGQGERFTGKVDFSEEEAARGE